MKKVFLIIFSIIILLFLIAAVIFFSGFEKTPFHHSIYTGNKDKQLYTQTFPELFSLLQKEAVQERGKGNMWYFYLNIWKTKAIVFLQETYTGDDSVGPGLYYFIAEKQPQGWTVTDYAVKTNCLRGKSARGICL